LKLSGNFKGGIEMNQNILTRTMKLYSNILTLVQEAWKTGYILIVLTNKNKLGIKNEQILIIIKEISGKTSDIKSHNKIETIRIEFL